MLQPSTVHSSGGFYLLAFQGLLIVMQEGAVLPDRGKTVVDQQIAEDMLADLEEQRPDMEESQ